MSYSFCVFRLDDIAPAMDWERFYRIKNIFDKHNVKPLIGVIPENKDKKMVYGAENPDFWEVIRQLQKDGWVIAQHGYQHYYVNQNSGMLKICKQSEFAGLCYADQVEKIMKGKKILEQQGVFSDIFMAPGHSFDKNTLRALKDCGFKYVSDGYSWYPFEYRGLKFLPSLYVVPRKHRGLITSYIHTNTAKDEVFGQIDDLISKNRDFIIDYSQGLKMPCQNTIWRFLHIHYILWRGFKQLIKSFLLRLSVFMGITINCGDICNIALEECKILFQVI